MARTALDLSVEELMAYDPRPRRSIHDPKRWAEAWELAKRAAHLLSESFGATRVVAFGSLAHRDCFHERSDVDLAAWGIPPERFYRAAAAITEIDPSIHLDLIDADHCPDRFRARLMFSKVSMAFMTIPFLSRSSR